ncbi:aconitate hydratase AcnA [Knoellia sp. CPCC 206450]|uniref:aconitate hydratase AcnA n=1 Tax=Knoellia tibetensis TaxID=3404798 RepID=UPI003B428F84
MTMTAPDSWTSRLSHDGRELAFVDLGHVFGPDLARVPHVLRLLAENIARCMTGAPRDEALAAMRAWTLTRTSAAEVDFTPNRLLMHDTTSTPALVDLAAMRDCLVEAGHDPTALAPVLPVEVSVDHSLAVEAFAVPDAVARNEERELRRNAERFSFLKWAATAMPTVHLNPPGTGIMHTINLEQLASVSEVHDGFVRPDVMLGTDSHTPMVGGMGVLGWGIGGLEAELVMLGLPTTLRIPDVVGVRLVGRLPEGVTATDLALTLTALLRELGVGGDFVEFHGPGMSTLTVGQRAVVANMAPEYGATTGHFPVDEAVLSHLRLVARGRVDPGLVEAHHRAAGLWFDPEVDPDYTRTVEVDLAAVRRTLAGPRRPQDALAPPDVPAVLEPPRPRDTDTLPTTPVALASITSCTNTSDPAQLVAAGLLARNARRHGLTSKPWVKTSMAPGSPAAQRYLHRSGLLDDLASVGFDLVGFGCTTCIGNSGPLPEEVDAARRAGRAQPVAVLSGNRNFPGRVHPDLSTGFLMSPALVVAYALLGDAARDVESTTFGMSADGREVRLADLMPTDEEVATATAEAVDSSDFPAAFHAAHASPRWAALEAPTGATFPWDPASTTLRRPPFARAEVPRLEPFTAHPLLVLGDDVTTDHISPASAIPPDSPLADFLVQQGEDRDDLGVLAARRGNWDAMVRGAFFNRTMVNDLVTAGAPGTTRHADGSVGPVFEVAGRYAADGTPVVVVAGERYGMGSSRDWAAKAQHLLGVRAVLAASFERIHRTNLVGMGILPLLLPPDVRRAIGPLDASDRFVVEVDPARLRPGGTVTVRHERADGVLAQLSLTAAVETSVEVDLLRSGGVIPMILRRWTGRG